MRVEVNGVRLFFDVDGAALRPAGPWLEERPTVVIVHTGPGTDHTAFKEHIGPALAEDAQVVYVDLRGSGDSDRSDPEHWNLETWSEDLRQLCDALGLDRPVVLGAGWGGFVVLRYAQRWPEHASKLVLTNPNARFVAPRSVARFDELGGAVVGEAAFEFFEHPNEQTIAEFLRLCFPTMIADGRASGLMMLSTWNLELALHWYGSEARTVDLRGELGRITAPTLIAAGTDDPGNPYVSIREVADGIAGAEVVVFEGARHSVFRDAPESIDVIKRWVLA